MHTPEIEAQRIAEANRIDQLPQPAIRPHRKAIDGVLSDAFRQLSGVRPARLMCYLPEVTSFEVLKTGSALQLMTSRFFELFTDIDYLTP